MNIQTAAVIDFQKPLAVSTDPKRFKIHFAAHITETQAFKLRAHLYTDLKMFQHYQDKAKKAGGDVIEKGRWLESARFYETGAMRMLESMQILHAIEEKEYQRLAALFVKHVALFDDIQAA